MPPPTEIDTRHRAAWQRLASPGDWLTGQQRTAVAHQARVARSCDVCARRAEALTPSAIDDAHAGDGVLGATYVDTVHRVAVDATRLTKQWAVRVIADMGEERYAEVVGIVASVAMLDMYRTAMGEPLDPVPAPIGGEPRHNRPSDVGDVGAWVSQAIEKRGANVSRALSLVPATQELFVTIESWQYSESFKDLVWSDRALTRPQTELVAATVAAVNECFY